MKVRPIRWSPVCVRPGMTLLVVLAMLSLFAAVAITFVLYADAEGTAARYRLQAQQPASPDADPELLLAYFLNQFLFDTKDDAGGVHSALRGHGLLRNQWGCQYEFDPSGAIQIGNNTAAFNGTGRLHQTYPATAPPALRLQDDYQLINYTYFADDGFVRDPERLGPRADPTLSRGAYFGGFNPPYTYPDLNHLYLAAMRADGTVLAPSYHRSWLFGPLDASNPNWTNPHGKYLLLRPRPAEHPPLNGRPGFPYPEDATGDVKNTIGPGGNDSFWLDLGFPVLTYADGRKYKPLFAPLVIDMDGKLDLNAHGNIRGSGWSHASNQGWGPWEVNVSRAFTADPSEAKNLFLGRPGVAPPVWGRYGPDGRPTAATNRAAFGSTPHFYGRVDFDGRQVNGSPTLPLRLPRGVQCFPTFPAGYDDGNAAESADHPSLYALVGPPGRRGAAFDRRFSPSALEALYRHGDTNAPALTSDVGMLCPKNFADARFRRLVTTLTSDLRRPGVAPAFWSLHPASQIERGPRYPNTPEKLMSAGPGVLPMPPGTTMLYDDFGREAPPTRVDVNRALPAYPPVSPLTGKITDAAGFAIAQQARQLLARDIFLRLLKATGAYDPTRYQTQVFSAPAYTEMLTLRWLAQWAVNIVDFVDEDEYSTPFPWAKLAGSPAFAAQFGSEWVFGVEMPRVLLNEVYAEYVNQPGETGASGKATSYHVNVWVELFNPLLRDATLAGSGAVRLDGAYQLLLTKANRNLASATDVFNVLGDPDNTSPLQAYDPSQVYRELDRFRPASIQASDTASQGFYVVGPPSPAPGVDAWEPGPAFAAMRTPALHYRVPAGPNPVATPAAPSLLLRRLACPALPWQPNAGLDSPATPYNPYVTVDYLDNIALNNGASNNGIGAFGSATPIEKRRSHGRDQPFNGNPQYRLPQRPAAARTKAPQHTFFEHNQDDVFNPRQPFDWLVHLDRPLISPMELVHVASCRPHLVTHLFKDTLNDGYQPFNHAPYWLLREQGSPLHRALELLETGCRAGGARSSDRLPGKINLNTVWDPEIFLALCDPQASNYFSAGDVQQIWQWLLAGRTPGGAPGPNDRPFKALASANFPQVGGMYAEGNGLADTLLRENPLHPQFDPIRRPIRLFEVVKGIGGAATQEHPYQRYELLTKIFNQVTPRSNVFAVWLTVGFFEVNDDRTRPVKLGAEIGRAEGRHVRHRMFALVDRSALVPIFPAEGQPPITSATPIPSPGSSMVVPSQMSDVAASNGNYAWSIQAGMMLRVAGPDRAGTLLSEDVVVSAVAANSFTAHFSQAYPRGLTSITAYGNPGPRTTPFNPSRFPDLVPHVSIIR